MPVAASQLKRLPKEADCLSPRPFSLKFQFTVAAALANLPAMQPLPQTQSCFACGKNNPHGLNLAFHTDGSQIITVWTPTPRHIGFADIIHGGIIAAVLDEIMAWACGILGGRFAVSVDISIRYLHPLRPGDIAKGIGSIKENRRGKIFKTYAYLRVADIEIASAAGTYLAVKSATEEKLLADFGSEASLLQECRATLQPKR